MLANWAEVWPILIGPGMIFPSLLKTVFFKDLLDLVSICDKFDIVLSG